MSRCRAEVLDDLQDDAATDLLLARAMLFNLEPTAQEQFLGVGYFQYPRAFFMRDPLSGGTLLIGIWFSNGIVCLSLYLEW